MTERLFEVVKFGEGRVVKYVGASHPQNRTLKADLYLTTAIYGETQASYAQIVPRMRPQWPTHREVADEALEDILARGWQENIPGEVRRLLATTRTAVFSGHGNTHDDLGWYSHIEGDTLIPVQTLVEEYLPGYETILLAVCNPVRDKVVSAQATLIYPAWMFGDSEETEMIIRQPE